MVWEVNNWLLPSAAQKVSVIFYLTNLCPVPAWMAIPGLLLVVLAALKARRLEISYAE